MGVTRESRRPNTGEPDLKLKHHTPEEKAEMLREERRKKALKTKPIKRG